MKALLPLAVLLVACGTRAAATGAASSASPPLVTASAATADQNRQLAVREADRLLSLARVPDGARPDTGTKGPLSGPVMGLPGVDSVVDHSRLWRVALAFEDLLAWVRAHPPAGLTPSGSSEGGDSSSHYRGYAYRAPATAAWRSSELDVSVTPDGDGASVIRADAVVVWLDPRPFTDAVRGPRLRLTVADGCPATDATMVGVTNAGAPDLDLQLVPPGEPVAGLVCEYAGSNGDAFHLRRQTVLGAAAAAHLAAVARALPLSHVVGGIRSCPMDDGTSTVLVLAYPTRADVDVWLHARGCPFVSNGSITTDAGELPRAIKDATR